MAFHTFFDIKISASLENTFQAVSDPRHLENWWPLKCSGKPVIGQIYNFNFTDQYDWYAQVEAVEFNRVIIFKMTKSDEEWNPTTFGFELEALENSTLLKFSHKNWVANTHHYRHSSYCWAMLLNGLKNYLEKSIIVPFENRS